MKTSLVRFGFGKVSAEYEAVTGSDFIDRMARSKNWERHLQYFFYQFCEKFQPKLVFDVGANIGFFSVFLAKLIGEGGRVVAFEPNSGIRPILERNLFRNGLPNVTVDPRVVSSGTAMLAFEAFGQRHEESYARVATDGESVPTVTIDAVSEELGEVPHLIKCDAEGFDLDVVAGAMDVLAKGQTAIVLEFQPVKMKLFSPSDPVTVLEQVRRLGYRPYFFRGHNETSVEEIDYAILGQLYRLWVEDNSAAYIDLLLWPPKLPRIYKPYDLPKRASGAE